MHLAALVPVKAFAAAKQRLADALDDTERNRLARATAAGVLRAVADHHPHVVCDDDDVAAWAVDHGAAVIRDPHCGLNPAIDLAIAHLAEQGFDQVLVVHGDLPRPAPLARLADAVQPGSIVIVPDRRLDGTNVMVVPSGCGLAAAYGPGSFRRHLMAALSTGRPVSVVRDVELGLDIDQPADLAHPLVRAAVDEILGRSDTVLGR